MLVILSQASTDLEFEQNEDTQADERSDRQHPLLGGDGSHALSEASAGARP